MKTKHVCRGLIGLYVNFCNNRTMWSTNLHVKICRLGGKEKELTFSPSLQQKFILSFLLTGSFSFPPTCEFLPVNLLTTLSDCYENLHTD